MLFNDDEAGLRAGIDYAPINAFRLKPDNYSIRFYNPKESKISDYEGVNPLEDLKAGICEHYPVTWAAWYHMGLWVERVIWRAVVCPDGPKPVTVITPVQLTEVWGPDIVRQFQTQQIQLTPYQRGFLTNFEEGSKDYNMFHDLFWEYLVRHEDVTLKPWWRGLESGG